MGSIPTPATVDNRREFGLALYVDHPASAETVERTKQLLAENHARLVAQGRVPSGDYEIVEGPAIPLPVTCESCDGDGCKACDDSGTVPDPTRFTKGYGWRQIVP